MPPQSCVSLKRIHRNVMGGQRRPINTLNYLEARESFPFQNSIFLPFYVRTNPAGRAKRYVDDQDRASWPRSRNTLAERSSDREHLGQADGGRDAINTPLHVALNDTPKKWSFRGSCRFFVFSAAQLQASANSPGWGDLSQQQC